MAFWSGLSLAVGAVALAAVSGRGAAPHVRLSLYVGTYTDGDSRGIYLIDLDLASSSFSAPRLVAEAVNPTFLAWHPSLPVLFSVSETDTVGPDRAGAVLSYRVGSDGGLTPLGQASTGGAGACHLSLDAAGTYALVANYGAGSVAVLGVDADGRVVEPARVYPHTGRGPHPTRQTRPHAHAIQVAPGGRFVLAADLGTDALMVYRWDPHAGRLTPHEPAVVKGRPGAGPRHVAFHPDGQTAFVVNELNSTVTTYAWDGEHGTLRAVSEASTLPSGWTGENTTAEVEVHPSGRFVYASNRGHDSIAIFAVQADRSLVPIGIHPTAGRTPRHFALDPTGAFLLVANQESDTIALVRVDANSGALTDTGARASVPAPVFVGFRPSPIR